jgi:hypothetical protein
MSLANFYFTNLYSVFEFKRLLSLAEGRAKLALPTLLFTLQISLLCSNSQRFYGIPAVVGLRYVPVVSCVRLSVPLLQDVILTAVVIVPGASAAARVSAVAGSLRADDNFSAAGVTNISDVPLLMVSRLLLAFLLC